MKIFAQNSLCPSQVLFAFDEVADASVERMRWAVAYSTRRGCERLVDRIYSRMGKTPWEKSRKHFVTSLDFGLTEPGALEFLSGLPESEVHVANPDVVNRPGLMPGRAYHPKVYLFDSSSATSYVVGSANLTDSALITNTEIVAVGKEVPGNGRWNDVWDRLMLDTSPLTTALLRDYRSRWVRPKRRAVEPEPKPKPPVIRPFEKPVFWEAITTGGIDPLAFNQFWVEAGSMSSGGSRNQLETPRGANRFFGFNYSDYEHAEHVVEIGYPTLTCRGRVWTDRPLRWHPNNRMERLNMPTVVQGGFDYQYAAVLFRRHSGGFEINVLPWNDEGAVAWRAASEALKTVFRLGEKGGRICGLF